jgi:hypothetical protein
MIEMLDQGTSTKTTSSYTRNKRIQYSCGCKYLFNHQILLEQICSEHERELITHNG